MYDFIGLTSDDWQSFFRLVVCAVGIIAFLTVYILLAQRRERRRREARDAAADRSIYDHLDSGTDLEYLDYLETDSDIDSDDDD